MGPRIYPSSQDTNTTAKGSLIMSMDVNVDYIDIFINNIFRQRQYPIIQNLYSIELSVGDVVRLERPVNFSIDVNRTDYTTDDTNGNNGIVNTHITGVSNTNSYTFTAQTLSNDYNFEYDISVGAAFGPTGYKATLIFTFISRFTSNLNTAVINPSEYYLYGQQEYTIPPDPNVWAFYANPIPFSGSTSYTQNLGYFPLLQETNNLFNALLVAKFCTSSKSGGILTQGNNYAYFKIYVNGNLVSTATYYVTDNGFGIVRPCSQTPLTSTAVNGTFTCNDGDIVEYLFDDSFVLYDNTPTPLPTNTPTPTPTITNTPTPSPTPTNTPTPTPTPTPVPVNFTTSGLTAYYDWSYNSYPNSGTTWFNIGNSGSTYNMSLFNTPTFNLGNPGYFNFNGTNEYGGIGYSAIGDNGGDYTLSLWIRPVTGSTEESFITRGTSISGGNWSLKLGKTTDNKFFSRAVSSGNVTIGTTGTTVFTTNTWYNVTLRFSDRLYIFVNGVNEGQVNRSFANLRTTSSSSFAWTFMRNESTDYAPGDVSIGAMYFRGLSDTEILNNFNNSKSTYGY